MRIILKVVTFVSVIFVFGIKILINCFPSDIYFNILTKMCLKSAIYLQKLYFIMAFDKVSLDTCNTFTTEFTKIPVV